MQSVLTKAHGCKRTNVVNPKLNSDLIRDALTFYVAKSDSSGITATFQFTSSSHCTGLLIVDINCYSNIYLVGYTSKVTTLSESKAGYTPTIDKYILSVPLGAWSYAVLITNQMGVIVN